MVTRRNFLQQAQSVVARLSGIIAFHSSGNELATLASTGRIGNHTMRQLRDQYRSELFDRFIPQMEKFVIDHRHGGFMCDFDIEKRVQVSSVKKTWSEGRGIWVYSFLYNRFGKNPRFLEIARGSVNFIVKHAPAGNAWWPASFTREGAPLPGAGDIYCSLYLAEGLAEFAQASGEITYRELAKSLIVSAMKRYDEDDYVFPVTYGPAGAPAITAPRVLGHWMVFLRSATVFLEFGGDAVVQQIATRCTDAILHRHLNPDYQLVNETLQHDFTLPAGAWNQFNYLATGIQSLWLVMYEALRVKNHLLFDNAQRLFNRHVQVATDPLYGGFFRSLDDVASNTFKTDKVLSLQEEVLIGSLLLTEHTQDDFAAETFSKTYDYICKKFYHPEFAFVVESGDRRMNTYATTGVGNYHHPRHLLLNLLALERMMKRRGKTSGIVEPVNF